MYIFYDLETSGLDRDFAQILQIGLIFTDDEFNILATKKLDCRRSPWVVPAPGALLTTGFTPDDLKNNKYSNFELMQEVDQWVRSQHWPVIFAGYNNIGYDDDLLAQNLHINLLDPGLETARAQGGDNRRNTRFDIMITVQAVEAYMPGAIKLDMLNDNGSPSVQLGKVARQNGVELSTDEAHDGLNDTKATIGVAKLLKKAAPQVWAQMQAMASDVGVTDFLANHKVFTHTKYDFGRQNSSVFTSVGARDGTPMTEVLFDLTHDPAPYMAMTAEQLKDAILDQGKKQPKGSPPKPDIIRIIQRDKQPILMPMDMSDPVLPKGFDEKVAQARADAIKADKQFQQNLSEAARLVREAKETKRTWTEQPEERLYENTKPAYREKLHTWMGEFLSATSWRQAAGLVNDFYTRFEAELEDDPSIRRFVKFAGRIVYEHAPEELTPDKQLAMKKFIAAHILNPDTKVPWMTVARAREELDKIEKARGEGKERWKDITDTQIRSLKLYYTALEKEFSPYLKPAPGNDNAVPKAPPAAAPDSSAPPPAAPDAKKAANDKFQP